AGRSAVLWLMLSEGERFWSAALYRRFRIFLMWSAAVLCSAALVSPVFLWVFLFARQQAKKPREKEKQEKPKQKRQSHCRTPHKKNPKAAIKRRTPNAPSPKERGEQIDHPPRQTGDQMMEPSGTLRWGVALSGLFLFVLAVLTLSGPGRI